MATQPKLEMCQRCEEPRPNGGPWKGEGGFTRLCTACKLNVTLKNPENRKKMEADLKRGMSALLGEVGR